MSYKVSIFLVLLMISNISEGQFGINEFNSKIQFERLDDTNWTLAGDNKPGSNPKGVLAFEHIPILDSLGRSVEPMIAIIYEIVQDSLDVIEYSIFHLGQKPFNLQYKLLGGYPDHSLDKHSVVFKGHYTRAGVKHEVLLGYILNQGIGLEIICDATTSVYPKVEMDMKNFVKSVTINE